MNISHSGISLKYSESFTFRDIQNIYWMFHILRCHNDIMNDGILSLLTQSHRLWYMWLVVSVLPIPLFAQNVEWKMVREGMYAHFEPKVEAPLLKINVTKNDVIIKLFICTENFIIAIETAMIGGSVIADEKWCYLGAYRQIKSFDRRGDNRLPIWTWSQSLIAHPSSCDNEYIIWNCSTNTLNGKKTQCRTHANSSIKTLINFVLDNISNPFRLTFACY